jgi:starch synthase
MKRVGRNRILFVASEAFPLAKTGGLGDVCGALPAALARLDVDVRLILPGYPQALDALRQAREVTTLDDPVFGEGRLVGGHMPDSDLPVLLYDAPAYFRRRGGLYQDEVGQDWGDNHRRFAAFCHAAAKVAQGRAGITWQPDIVHSHDWHAGLVPALLAAGGGARPQSVFTIHNLAFQGNFPLGVFPEIGLPPQMVSSEGVEFYGNVSFLKAGLRYGNRLTTVSPNYAREILTPEHGCGMEGLLQARAADLLGILNGVDYNIWCPSRDGALPCQYTPEDLSGKAACKAALQQELGLPVKADLPLVIFVNRLTHQKMADALLDSIPSTLASGAQLVIHGTGDRAIERRLEEMQRTYPAQLVVRIGYSEAFAHRLHAGADLALTPARFEPCGLTTMYAMRYGAVPVTRKVGGLADTVENVDAAGSLMERGTGFVFQESSADHLTASLRRAVEWYRSDDLWRPVQVRAMRRDFGWERSAQRYLALYREMLGSEAAPAEEAEPLVSKVA